MLEKIRKEDYYELLKTYNFHYYPRFIGNPMQFPVTRFDELWDNFLQWNGNHACFNSHNAFRDIRTVKGKSMPQKVLYTSIHHDFDSKKKENAQNDLINLSRFLDQEGLPHLNVFTGGKGFQCFLLTKPQLYSFDTIKRGDNKYSNQDAIKMITRGVQKYFKDKLNLRTLDSVCMGTPKKQSRALYTYHRFTRSKENKGTVAIPLTKELLYDTNILDIIEYSKDPDFIIPGVEGKYMTLIEIFEHFGISLLNQDKEDETAKYRPINSKVTNKSALLFLGTVGESKPCIASEMMSTNPSHKMRIAFAVFAKKLGITREKFTEIYESLGYKIPFIDIHNKEFRDYQIEWLWNNSNYNREAGCSKIKKLGKCLKFKCRRYKNG